MMLLCILVLMMIVGIWLANEVESETQRNSGLRRLLSPSVADCAYWEGCCEAAERELAAWKDANLTEAHRAALAQIENLKAEIAELKYQPAESAYILED